MLGNQVSSDTDYYDCDFLYQLFSAWLDYFTYHKESLYFPYRIYRYFTLKHAILVFAEGAKEQILQMDERFFEIFKTYYVDQPFTEKATLLARFGEKCLQNFNKQTILNYPFERIKEILIEK